MFRVQMGSCISLDSYRTQVAPLCGLHCSDLDSFAERARRRWETKEPKLGPAMLMKVLPRTCLAGDVPGGVRCNLEDEVS